MQMIQNITQTLKAQASLFLSASIPGDFLKNPPTTKEERAALRAKLPPSVLDQLAKLGVELPTDLVDVNLELGSLIFDIVYSRQTPPEAPLRKALFEREKQDLAANLNRDYFILPPASLQELKTILSDEELWKKVKVSVYTGDPANPNKNYFTFSYLIANNFNKVMEACVDICLPPRPKPIAPPPPPPPPVPPRPEPEPEEPKEEKPKKKRAPKATSK